MEIRAILLNVDLRRVDAPALRYAVDLAAAFDAEIVGLGADQPDVPTLGDDTVSFELYDDARQAVEKELVSAEVQFQALVPPSIRRQWLGHVFNPIQAMVDAAGAVDVIVTGSTARTVRGTQVSVDVGELVLASGRPVINVGDGTKQNIVDRVVIAWKDTRESRRAVADALPLLVRAKEVTAITLSEGDEEFERRSLDDLAGWLDRHGVCADRELIRSGREADVSKAALDRHADFFVTGAYGHGRLQEWLFGGVTRSLLKANSLNRLFSH